jgi:hypothetical protein
MAPHDSKIAEDKAMPISRYAFRLVALLGAMLCAPLSPRIAMAALGDTEASVQMDVAELQASIKSSENRAGYRVHEILLPSGSLLREFVSLDGTVFGVAWNGRHPPNLRQALGKYFDNYASGARFNHADHNHLQIQEDDLVMQVQAHMRAYSGRAYIPAALPSGFNLGDLH